METLSIYLIGIIDIVMMFLFIRSLPKNHRFLYTAIVPVVFFFLNYPVRAVILINSPGNSFSEYQILMSLFYSTAFMAILLITYRLNTTNSVYYYDPDDILVREKDIFSNHITFAIYISVFAFKLSTGRLYGLYEDISDLQNSFLVNFIIMFDALKWYCLASCFVIYGRLKKKLFIVEGLIVTSAIIFESVASTSKGTIVSLLIFYLFVTSINKSRINYILVALLSVATYYYMVSTYLVRQHGVVKGSFNIQALINNYGSVSDLYQYQENKLLGTQGVVERFNYLDGLIMTIQSYGQIDLGIYFLGGVAELLNILPRMVWEDRPRIALGMFLTQNVWGFGSLYSETPVGRIGESFLVLGYAGLIYAVIYGILFAKLENKIFQNLNVTAISMYFVILFNYVWSDVHIIFNWKLILWVALTIVAIGKLFSFINSKSL